MPLADSGTLAAIGGVRNERRRVCPCSSAFRKSDLANRVDAAFGVHNHPDFFNSLVIYFVSAVDIAAPRAPGLSSHLLILP